MSFDDDRKGPGIRGDADRSIKARKDNDAGREARESEDLDRAHRIRDLEDRGATNEIIAELLGFTLDHVRKEKRRLRRVLAEDEEARSEPIELPMARVRKAMQAAGSPTSVEEIMAATGLKRVVVRFALREGERQGVFRPTCRRASARYTDTGVPFAHASNAEPGAWLGKLRRAVGLLREECRVELDRSVYLGADQIRRLRHSLDNGEGAIRRALGAEMSRLDHAAAERRKGITTDWSDGLLIVLAPDETGSAGIDFAYEAMSDSDLGRLSVLRCTAAFDAPARKTFHAKMLPSLIARIEESIAVDDTVYQNGGQRMKIVMIRAKSRRRSARRMAAAVGKAAVALTVFMLGTFGAPETRTEPAETIAVARVVELGAVNGVPDMADGRRPGFVVELG